MLHLYDRATMARGLTLDLDPSLHRLLSRRIAALGEELIDWTEYLIIEPDDGESDLIREVGFSPLVDPVDGARYGEKGFLPFWDHLVEEDGHFILTISFGSTFAYILVIPDRDDILPVLRCLCRQYAQ